VEKLFAQFDAMLSAAGFTASGGQIIDATFVEVPRGPVRISVYGLSC
jgi:hypothetical protein